MLFQLTHLQILFARQSLTSMFSLAYGYYAHAPHFPFGPRNLLSLLIARGLFGFFGVFGLYFALLYLPLAEATVLTFLAPILTCYVCALLIPGESFSRQQQFAALLSLVGVVVIARPVSLFHNSFDSSTQPTPTPEMAPNATSGSPTFPFSDPPRPTAHQHLVAVLVSMLGVIGSCGAMTAIRWIGTRAHPLISVNYFSVWCTIVSLFAVIFVPGVDFRLPANLVEWGLLASLGGCGYALQFLLTAGLAYGGPSNESSRSHDEERPGKMDRERDKMKQGSGTRATNMVYTQMLFALAFDKLIWGITPGAASWTGSGLILGSAVWVAVAREKDCHQENTGNLIVGGDDTGAGAVITHVKKRPGDGGTAEEEQGLMSGGGLEQGESSREALEMEDLSLRQSEQREVKESATFKDHDPPDI
jgi:drug/metabolite transporter (DMT)-like permease